MDYLYTDRFYDDVVWRGLACRVCGSPPQRACRSRKGTEVRVHSVRRHDLIGGKPCECGRCLKGPKPLDRTSQN